MPLTSFVNLAHLFYHTVPQLIVLSSVKQVIMGTYFTGYKQKHLEPSPIQCAVEMLASIDV